MNEWKTFTGRLLWAMSRAGKTNQSELARAVGVKPQSIQYLCRADSGAQGSTHTPALAHELRVAAHWLASGEGHPADVEQTGLRFDDSASPSYVAGPVTRAKVTGTYRLTGTGDVEVLEPEAGWDAGHVLTPIVATGVHAIRVKGNALSPYVKDGQYLLLQSGPDQLPSEENILITLVGGQKLLRELMHQRDGSLVVLPVQGGQPEAIEVSTIQQIDSVVCVVSRRWWQAGDGSLR
jgi:hypothetical protein